MKNLAGVVTCDSDIVRELLEAEIPIIPCERIQAEVAASFTGELNGWRFRRAWYYWVATPISPNKGLPMDKAYALHTWWGTDARVNGSCIAPHPDEGTSFYHLTTGDCIVIDPGKLQLALFQKFKLSQDGLVFVESLDEIPSDMVHTVIPLYHIDSQGALNAFANIIR